MSAPIAWFEIGSSDPTGAEEFYESLFGWKFAKEFPGYTMVTTGEREPIGGGLADVQDGSPPYAIFYVEVEDVTATCRHAEELGGKVILPKTAISSGRVFAHLQDRDGNRFAVISGPR